jgi:hypothetical protein
MRLGRRQVARCSRRLVRGVAARCLALAAIAAVGDGCDRNIGTVELELLTPPGSDPFELADVVEIRIDVAGRSPWSQTIDLESGPTLTFPDLPVGDGWTISVEAQSVTDVTFARGKSLPLVVHDGTNRVDLYVANTGQFSRAAESEITGVPRGGHAAVALPNGQVLLVGGGATLDVGALAPEAPAPVYADFVDIVELFDPTSGRAVQAGECTGAPSESLCLVTPRLPGAVGRTARGDVLIAGGGAPGIERMQANSLVFRSLGGEIAARFDPTLAQTPRGAVLIGGSQFEESTFLKSVLVLGADGEPYEEFEQLLKLPRAGATAASIGSSVFVFGGMNHDGVVDDVELLDVSGDIPSSTLISLGNGVTARLGAAAAVVDDRFVMLIGGVAPEDLEDPGRFSVSREIDVYVPSTGLFCNVGSLPQPRYLHSVAVLPDYGVLVVGGIQELEVPQALNDGYLINSRGIMSRLASETCAELQQIEEPSPVPCAQRRIAPTATALGNGMVLVAGGFDTDGSALASYEIYVP